MQSLLHAYSEIVRLLQQWGEGQEGADASELVALRRYDVETLKKAISSIFTSGNAQLRIYAIEAIPYLVPRELMIELLIPCLHDERVVVRWKSCKMLQQHPAPRATMPLMELLRKEKNPDIRVVAADALGKIGNTQAISVLTDAIKNDKGKDFGGKSVAKIARVSIAAIKERMKST